MLLWNSLWNRGRKCIHWVVDKGDNYSILILWLMINNSVVPVTMLFLVVEHRKSPNGNKKHTQIVGLLFRLATELVDSIHSLVSVPLQQQTMSILSLLSLDSAADLTVVTDNAKSHGYSRASTRRRRHPCRRLERSHSDDGQRLLEAPQKHHHRRRMSSDGPRYHPSRWESDSSMRGNGGRPPYLSTSRRDNNSLPPSSPVRSEQPQHSFSRERRRSEMPTRWESIPTITSNSPTHSQAAPKRWDSVPTLPTKSDQPPIPKAREITIMNTLARNPSSELEGISDRLSPPCQEHGGVPDMDAILAKALDTECWRGVGGGCVTWCQPSRCTPHLQRIREGDFEDLSFHHITQNKFLVDKKKTRCPNQKVLRKELPVGACT